ncbi:MAG: hypothetical protein ABSB79_12440 [Syntrophales bacterium]
MGKSDPLADPVKFRLLISTGCPPEQRRQRSPVLIIVWLPSWPHWFKETTRVTWISQQTGKIGATREVVLEMLGIPITLYLVFG